MRASHCGGFSFCGAWALGTRASVAVSQGLITCGAEANLPPGSWDLPRPGIEPVCPALAGESLTSGPPGKSSKEVAYEVEALRPEAYYFPLLCPKTSI